MHEGVNKRKGERDNYGGLPNEKSSGRRRIAEKQRGAVIRTKHPHEQRQRQGRQGRERHVGHERQREREVKRVQRQETGTDQRKPRSGAQLAQEEVGSDDADRAERHRRNPQSDEREAKRQAKKRSPRNLGDQRH